MNSIKGTLLGDGAGYCEYFETTDGKAIDVGCTVCLDNGKVRVAGLLDNPIGVVRPKSESEGISNIIGNSYEDQYQGKWDRDEFGRIKKESYTWVEWEQDGKIVGYREDELPDDVIPPENARRILNIQYKYSPGYDPALAYEPRSKRPEWVLVGLLGQMPIKVGQRIGNWIFIKNVGNGSVARIYLVK